MLNNNEKNIEIRVIPVNQNGNIFYVGKMSAKLLSNIATTKVRRAKNSTDYIDYFSEVRKSIQEELNEGNVWYLKGFTDEINVQRNQSKERLKEIGKYIEKANTIFPNSIICNIASLNDDVDIFDLIHLDETQSKLSFNSDDVELTIIDGQHRLGGFDYTNNKEYYLNNYELIVTILIGLLPAQQAELFATINGKQKQVNKSVLYDLSSMSEKEYSIQMLAHLIVTWMNVNEVSPLKDCIKMLGNGKGTISQAAFIEALQPLLEIKNKKINYDKLELPIFGNNANNNDSKSIVINLLDYFTAISKIYNDKWNKNSILMKSTGIVGLIKAYSTIFMDLKELDRKKRYNELLVLIKKSKDNGFTPDNMQYVGGGASLQKKFAEDLLISIYGSLDDAKKIRMKF